MSSITTTAAAQGSGDAESEEVPFTLNPTLMQFGEYNGMRMGYYRDPLEVHVPKVMKLSLRDTDIVLLTYLKSGTHWVWRILDMLATGSATYSKRFAGTFFLDLMPTDVIDNVSKNIRRVINTHYPSDLLPAQIKDGGVKVVHVYRHPKAVLVSLLFHMQNLGKFPDITLDKLGEMVHAGKVAYKSQFYYLDKMQEYERNNPNVDIFHLAYEDMKKVSMKVGAVFFDMTIAFDKDTVGCIRKLAAYLNVDASDELCSNIAEAVSFSKQKSQEEAQGNEHQTNMGYYRKGEVDDWKNHLTVAQSERMDKVLADRAASCQFCRRYCPAITTDQGHVYRLSSDN